MEFIILPLAVIIFLSVPVMLLRIISELKSQARQMRDLRESILNLRESHAPAKTDLPVAVTPSAPDVPHKPAETPPIPADPPPPNAADIFITNAEQRAKLFAASAPFSLLTNSEFAEQRAKLFAASARDAPHKPAETLPADELPAAEPPHPIAQPSPSTTEAPSPNAVELFMSNAWQRAKQWIMKEGNIWVLSGVVVLLFGTVFGIHYSITQGWFSPAMRLASLFALGFALLVTGVKLANKRRVYALLLQGCGLSMMYLSTVAAARMDTPLLGATAALSVLSVLVAATAILALRQDAQLVAHFAAVAGFFAPVLVSQGSADFVGLFSFYLLLNIGILAMSFVRPWRRLYLTGFALTFGLFGLWVFKSFEAEMFAKSFPFLVAYYLLYVFMGIRALPAPGETRASRFSTDATLTLLAPLFFLSLATRMVESHYLLAAVFTSCGVLYAALSVAFRKRSRNTVALLRTEALLCVNLALPIFLRGYAPVRFSMTHILSLVWSLEGAALCVMGARENKTENRALGVVSFFVAGAMCFWSLIHTDANIKYFSIELFCALALVASLITTAGALAAHGAKKYDASFTGRWFMTIGLVLLYVAFLLGTIHVSRVCNHAFLWLFAASSIATLSLALAGKIFPILMEIGSPKKRNSLLDLVWLPTFALALICMFIRFENLAALQSAQRTFSDYELVAWLLFLISGAFLLSPFAPRGTTRLTLVNDPQNEGFVRTDYCVMVALLLGYALGALSGDTLTSNLILKLPLLAFFAVIIFVRLPRRVSDFIRPQNSIFLPVTLSALAFMQLPSLLASDAKVLGFYLPLFNPVDLLGLATLALPLAWCARRWRENRDALLRIGATAWLLIFILLNILIARAVHHYTGAEFTNDDIGASNIFQTAASVVWGAVGIGTMIVSFRRSWRVPWIMGAVLLGADVLKLFMIDLSKIGTIARVISFVIVGLLLILVGYFAPLPPKMKPKDAVE